MLSRKQHLLLPRTDLILHAIEILIRVVRVLVNTDRQTAFEFSLWHNATIALLPHGN
jgi:hypothetical protein